MPSYPLLFTSIALLLLLLHLHHTQKPPPQQIQQQYPLSPQFSFQEKTRLGSTPPSCHNKCNGCHPCIAVQIPSVPGRKSSAAHGDVVVVDQEQSSSSSSRSGDGVMRNKKRLMPDSVEYFNPTPAAASYSNYKPLGWKCRCGNHFFSP